MNIVNKLTLRHLRKNKRRTLVTIIGVIISVAMLTAVATLAVSFMSLFQKQEIANGGEWHALYKNVDEKQLKAIQSDKNTKSVVLSRDVGYADLKDSENSDKPYIFLKEYNESGFNQFPIELKEGKIPTNEKELLISDHIATNAKVDLQIGDKVSYDIGERMIDDEEMNTDQIDQSYPLQTGEIAETIENPTKKDFTIVGIMERPTWEPMSAPGYTVLSYLPEDVFAAHDTVHASVTWNKVNRSAVKNAEQLGNDLNLDDYSLNNNLLRYYGVIRDDNLRTTLFTVAAIIMVVIIIGSVSLIYNAFAISVSERSRHLGMLSSVGATKKQKRNSVFFEGLVIGSISIPLGILSGIAGIGITFHFINSLIQGTLEIREKLTVVVTPLSIIVACAVSLLTIFISTYIPAKRASKVTAIDAIRQTMDIKMTHKKVKTSKLVRKLFGIEAEFGLKNLKRNKRRYAVIVFSLVISIILFLTVSFFADQIKQSTSYVQSDVNYDIELSSFTAEDQENHFTDSFIDSITSLEKVTGHSFIQQIQLETSIDEKHTPDELKEHLENGKYPAQVSLHVLDDESLKAYAKDVGVSYQQLTEKGKITGIVIDTAPASGEKRGETKAIIMNAGDSLEVSFNDWTEGSSIRNIELGAFEAVALTDKRPMGVDPADVGSLNMVVSEETFAQLNADDEIKEIRYALYLTSTDPIATDEKIEELKDTTMYLSNLYKNRQDDEQMTLLISVFTYGFIALITAISVANIFNTIATSISLRKREFGMLKSVGMTPKGFNRMIHYESIFYGIKSLVYGLPISIGIMYVIYRSMMGAFDYPFSLPWLSILYVIVGVFIIVGLAMLYASSKVKKENIIEALKQENI